MKNTRFISTLKKLSTIADTDGVDYLLLTYDPIDEESIISAHWLPRHEAILAAHIALKMRESKEFKRLVFKALYKNEALVNEYLDIRSEYLNSVLK